MTGYSGKPVEQKLGLKAGQAVRLLQVPEDYFSLFETIPDDLVLIENNVDKIDFGHIFATTKNELRPLLQMLKKQLQPNGMIWVSWPKRQGRKPKFETRNPNILNENMIRQLALAEGLVDVKVCAINDLWSGLKLVIRLKDRPVAA